MPTSEGRKDPFASVYSYLPVDPEEIFYDFSCQLEEYSLNREPNYWKQCRFWHDVFHGYSHKCSYVYKSQHISSLQSINSEICEQFNSFIQRIKYSSRSMSQSHFIFYLQFFIHFWNKMKKKTFDCNWQVATSLVE